MSSRKRSDSDSEGSGSDSERPRKEAKKEKPLPFAGQQIAVNCPNAYPADWYAATVVRFSNKRVLTITVQWEGGEPDEVETHNNPEWCPLGEEVSFFVLFAVDSLFAIHSLLPACSPRAQ